MALRTALLLILILPSVSRADETWLLRQSGSVAQPAHQGTERTTGEIELRIGAAWPGEGHGTDFGLGGRLAVYPWHGSVTRRVAIQVSGEWAELSRTQGTLAGLPGRTQTSIQWSTFGPLLGFDIVRFRRIVLDGRVGGEFDVMRTIFRLEGDDAETICIPTCTTSGDGFVDVCKLVAFSDQCHSRTRFGGVVALGVRGWPQSAKPWFVGMDYSANSAGRRRFVATIGLGPRRQ